MAVELGAEHHLEVRPVGDGEMDVGDTDLEEAAGRLMGLPQRGCQAPEPVGGDRGQQPGLVAEMVGRGSVGDAGAAGEVAQRAQRPNALIALVYVGAVVLAAGVLTLGINLL